MEKYARSVVPTKKWCSPSGAKKEEAPRSGTHQRGLFPYYLESLVLSSAPRYLLSNELTVLLLVLSFEFAALAVDSLVGVAEQ